MNAQTEEWYVLAHNPRPNEQTQVYADQETGREIDTSGWECGSRHMSEEQ